MRELLEQKLNRFEQLEKDLANPEVLASPARITAVARHLTDPARKVYMIDMEGPIWEVDVRTLKPTRLFVKPVPGWHAKGGYTGQGRLIVANNGELRTADLDKLRWEAPEAT